MSLERRSNAIPLIYFASTSPAPGLAFVGVGRQVASARGCCLGGRHTNCRGYRSLLAAALSLPLGSVLLLCVTDSANEVFCRWVRGWGCHSLLVSCYA